MSVKASLVSIRIPFKPLNQIANYNALVTYLNKGTYLVTYNLALQAIAGNLTSVQGIVSCVAPYGNPGTLEICAGPKTGAMGTPGTAVFCQSIQNNVVIANDNTPIYINLFMNYTAFTTWQIATSARYNDHMNYLTIVQS